MGVFYAIMHTWHGILTTVRTPGNLVCFFIQIFVTLIVLQSFDLNIYKERVPFTGPCLRLARNRHSFDCEKIN